MFQAELFKNAYVSVFTDFYILYKLAVTQKLTLDLIRSLPDCLPN